MTHRYKLMGLDVVDTETGLVKASYSEHFRASAEFHVKILNGLIYPHWEDNGSLVWKVYLL
jgi:hypothetical protein